MKTILSILSIAVLAIGIYSCDKVEHPTLTKDTAVGTTFDSVSNFTVAGFKKVMLEDYTGHRCGNCPAAARLAETLKDQYKDTLIIIAIHAGYFTNVIPAFPDSYTTTVGNDWDGTTGFNVSGTGNPNGMVNRKVYPGFTLVHKDTWATTVSLAKKDSFIVKVNITSKYDHTARALNVDTKLTFRKAYNNNVNLNLILTEDSIVGDQLDYSLNPDHLEDYRFDNMLRDAINGSWGELAKTGPIAANSTVSILHSNFAVNSKFNDKKVSLIAFVYDAVTREVLQVEKIKIRK